MIRTAHLIIADRQPEDVMLESAYLILHPEVAELDPAVGECINPVFYSIFTKDTNRHIGVCCLYNPTGTAVELGIRIFEPNQWNKGYGTEVVNALCEFTFNSNPALALVQAKTPIYNTRAIRCYEKCKFTQYAQAILGKYDMVFMMRPRGGKE